MEAATSSAHKPPETTRPVARATDSPLGGVAGYAAELLGTFALVFFVTAVVVVYSGDGLGYQDFTVIGLVHTFVLMVLIYSLGGASGAHFNPAVTIALLVGRKIRPPDAAIYIVMQLIGGVLGALVTKLLLDNEGSGLDYGLPKISDAAAAPAVQPGAPAPATGPDFLGGSKLGGAAVEALGTFFLMWAIMAAAVNPRAVRAWAGFIIGATLGLVVMVLAPLTGASFNPARWLGPAVWGKEFVDFWVYALAPIVGAILAYIAYSAIVLTPQERQPGVRPIDKLD